MDKSLKLIFKSVLTLTTPLLIGSGKEENSDIDILKTKDEIPFIPATSIVGILRLSVQKYKGTISEDIFDEFWGAARDSGNEKQSSIIVSDSYLLNNNVQKENSIISDGIRINPGFGTAEDGAKFDYEIIDKGSSFSFEYEVTIPTDKSTYYYQMIKTIESCLNDKISIGANTNNGFGRFELSKSRYYFYNLSSTNDIWKWLEKSYLNESEGIEKLEEIKVLNNINPFRINQSNFTITFTANIDNSLIIGSTDPKVESDKIHLKSNGEAVLSGSSLKGAVRARAEKILNTISINQDEMHKLKELLFGYIQHEFIIEKDNNGNEIVKPDKINGSIYKETKIKSLKGKLQVSENTFKEKTYTEELQHRIKIDRFTGGTIDGALFDSMPLFNTAKEESSITFDMNIDWSDRKYELKDENGKSTGEFIGWSNYKNAAAGLLLLVLKDLWTGDLPIGGEKNVGRGRLRGVSATITWDDKKVVLKSKDNIDYSPDVVEGSWEELEGFVIALNDLVGKS